jgi:acyl carrier protein
MEKTEVETRVKKVVAQVLKVAEAELSNEKSFTADLGAESIQSVELMAAFEEEFDIEMDEEEAGSVQTVGAAVDFIYGYVKD